MDDFGDTLYECIGEMFTQGEYDNLIQLYEDKLNNDREEMRTIIHDKCREFEQQLLTDFNNKMIAKDEHYKIDRVMRIALLDYFNRVALNIYDNDLRNILSHELVRKIKQFNIESDINDRFFEDDKHVSAKLVYALKLNMIPNKTNIPVNVINKYIALNQNVHFTFKPFKTNGAVQIRKSIEKIKSIGCPIDDENEITEICKFIE